MVELILIKYNDKDKNALLKGRDFYSGILIEGTLALLRVKNLSKLLNDVKKPFAIDPATYRFHSEFDGDEDRISIQNLKEKYGLSIDDSIYPELFTSNFAKSFVSKIVEFQNTIFSEKQTLLMKYLTKGYTLQPSWIIPPYFPIEDFKDPWMNVNVQLALYTSHLAPTKKIIPIICILEKDTLFNCNEEDLRKLVKKYPGELLGLWIADFDKKSISEEYLQGYYDFVKVIQSLNKKLLLLYANFFDILLRPFGISHGIFSGNVKYSGGWSGREYDKIYVPFLHRSFTVETAVPILVKYGTKLNYSNVKNIIQLIKELQSLDMEYSKLKQIGTTTKGFRLSKLSEEDKKRHKDIKNKIKNIRDILKVEFLKERNKECKKIDEFNEEIKQMKEVVATINRTEKSIRITKKYTGHLERWIRAVK